MSNNNSVRRGFVEAGFIGTKDDFDALVEFAEERGMGFVWGGMQGDDHIGWPAEADRLREGLLQCATEAGEDVRDGVPTWPDVVDWAVRAVREGRETYEQDNNDLTTGIVKIADWIERDRRESDKVLCHLQSLRRLTFTGRVTSLREGSGEQDAR
jgi:hypothetical protein